MIRALMISCALVLSAGCQVIYRGGIGGDCEPPKAPSPDLGDPQSSGGDWRRTNCVVADSICCRRSANARQTLCSYPEDCYVAPHMGRCVTAVDCVDDQACIDGTCQCNLGGPPCEKPLSPNIVTCCRSGEVCMNGACTTPANADLGP